VLDLASIDSCTELTSEHAKEAAASSTGIRLLLRRVSEIARPDEGCPKVLMAVARLVGQDWVEGELRVELTGDDGGTTLTIMCEHGVGIRERLLPATRFDGVPLDEFSRALELAPGLALPLRITDEEGKIVLAPLLTPEDQIRSKPPPDFEVDDRSLGEEARTTAPPPPGAPEAFLHEHPTPPNGIPVAELGWPEEIIPPEAVVARVGAAEPAPAANDASTTPTARPSAPEVVADEAAPPEHRPARASGIRSFDGGEGAVEDAPPPPSVHTRPTVRRMVAVDVSAVRRRDPRRDDDD